MPSVGSANIREIRVPRILGLVRRDRPAAGAVPRSRKIPTRFIFQDFFGYQGVPNRYTSRGSSRLPSSPVDSPEGTQGSKARRCHTSGGALGSSQIAGHPEVV